MKIYQLYYADSCLPQLQEGFVPRKNNNPDPNSLYRENLDIIDIYYNEDWRKEDYIGLVSWRFFEKTGLTYNDIARALDISVKTVETQMGRALKSLRSSLASFRGPD